MNPYKEAAQSMMQAGIGSLSGNTINKPPLSTPKENYIRETHDLNSPTNVINRKIQDFNNLKKSYEGTGIVPQTFPNWVTQNPDASGMINTWGRYNRGAGHSGSIFGTPMWMDAGITNPDLGGAKVWNAGSPFAGDYALPGMQWLEHKLFGDPEDKQGPPVDNEGNLLPGWKLHQDGWHYFPPYEGDDEDTPIKDKFFEKMDTPYTLEADLKLQDVIDLYESKGLDLNTDRFMRRAKNAGVEVTGMNDSWQYLQQQMNELNPDSPNYDDQLEMLMNDWEMKYPWVT
jgi:hypothetical protein